METRKSDFRSCASRAPAGGLQHCSICCLTKSISLVVSCGPNGAIGCEEDFAGAAATCLRASSGMRVGLFLARFLSIASTSTSSFFFFGGSGFGSGGLGSTGLGSALASCGLTSGGGGGGGVTTSCRGGSGGAGLDSGGGC